MKKLLILVLLLSGCGTEPRVGPLMAGKDVKPIVVDPSLYEYCDSKLDPLIVAAPNFSDLKAQHKKDVIKYSDCALSSKEKADFIRKVFPPPSTKH